MSYLVAAMLVAHFGIVVALLLDPRRLGRDSGDQRKDSMYSTLGAWLAYVPIFAAQGYGLWRAWSRPSTGLVLAGAAIFSLGLALRLWSVRTLGRFFTMEIGVRDGHALVDQGPYRILRHPSYTGYVLILLGIGLACGSWVALAIPLAMTAIFLAIRIREEERMLIQALGQAYVDYRKRTYRLIPYVY